MTSKTFEEIKKEEEELLFRTYGRYPVAVDRGLGSKLWDYDGKEYTDLLTGIAVTTLGHANEEIAETISAQARKLTHVSNLFYQKEQLNLARRLLATADFGKVFFCNSGAEANEGAIKLARRYHQRVKNENRYEVITFEGCFHGRTLAALAATGQASLLDGFDPVTEGFIQVPYGSMEALEQAASSKTAAVLLEVVQGESGIRPATAEYVENIAKFCREKGILFIVDEVQAGMGRTGKWWAFQHFAVQPDILTTAKAIANGLPMGVIMATDEVARAFTTGSHGTTFGAGALVCAVADKVLEIIERDGLIPRAGELGAWAKERFLAVGAAVPGTIKEVRGMGLMIGIELTFSGKEIWNALIDKGFLMNLTRERTLRLLPGLIITQEELEAFAVALQGLLEEHVKKANQ